MCFNFISYAGLSISMQSVEQSTFCRAIITHLYRRDIFNVRGDYKSCPVFV